MVQKGTKWPCNAWNVVPAAYPAIAYIAPLKRRSTSGTPRRTLNTAAEPTIAAPTPLFFPSSTTAASVAAELGDHAHCRSPSMVGVESHTRKRRARAAQVAQNPGLTETRVTRARMAAAAETIAAIYSQVAEESLPMSSPRARSADLPGTQGNAVTDLSVGLQRIAARWAGRRHEE